MTKFRFTISQSIPNGSRTWKGTLEIDRRHECPIMEAVKILSEQSSDLVPGISDDRSVIIRITKMVG